MTVQPKRLDFWIFRRAGARRFTVAWCPDPATPQARQQATLPKDVTTRPQARAWLDEHGDHLRRRTAGDRERRAAGLTVAELVPRWLEMRNNDDRLAGSTVADNKSHARVHLVPEFGKRRPPELTVPVLREWIRKLRARVAPYTCRNIHSSLVAFLDDVIGEKWAVLSENTARSEAVRSELPEGRPLAGRSQKLRIRTEIATLLVSSPLVPPERRVRYVVDFTGGYRDGELSGAFICDARVDERVPVLEISRALQLKHRDGGARLGATKTEDSKRITPLHPAAVAALKWWIRAGWERYVGRKPRPTDPLFPSRRGLFCRPRSAELLRADLEAVDASTKVDGFALGMHACRRSFAHWLQAAGVPDDARARLLGHVPESTGDRHYTDADLHILADFVNRIPLAWTDVKDSDWETCVKPLLHKEPMSEHAMQRARKAG